MIQQAYFEFYFFLIRLCTCIISVLLHRGARATKLRKAVFPRWTAVILVADMLITTRPPWMSADSRKQHTPYRLFVSLLACASFQWPLLWWMHFMETKRRGLALALAMAMLFHRSSFALVVACLQYTACAHALLTLIYVWSTLSLRASAKADEPTTV